ncbi:MAG: hypothetical protein ABI824_13275 [Acidobacteriota bacterium]
MANEIGIPLLVGALDQLKAKLNRGAAQSERGELLDGDVVFEELRQAVEEQRAKPIHQ